MTTKYVQWSSLTRNAQFSYYFASLNSLASTAVLYVQINLLIPLLIRKTFPIFYIHTYIHFLSCGAPLYTRHSAALRTRINFSISKIAAKLPTFRNIIRSVFRRYFFVFSHLIQYISRRVDCFALYGIVLPHQFVSLSIKVKEDWVGIRLGQNVKLRPRAWEKCVVYAKHHGNREECPGMGMGSQSGYRTIQPPRSAFIRGKILRRKIPRHTRKNFWFKFIDNI